MREIINIHIGQAGVQVGDTLWELYRQEHDIQPDGTQENITEDDSTYRFFQGSKNKKHEVRAVFIDLDPTSIDQISKGRNRGLLNSRKLISGNEDASNLYSRGRYCLGPEILETCLDKMRLVAEQWESLQGFQIFHSMSGGTGSGLGSLLMEQLSCEYQYKRKVSYSIYPFYRSQSSIVEPYNWVLANQTLAEHTDAAFVMDNDAIYNKVYKNLEIERPSYQNMNELISQVISSTTASMRFDGFLNNALGDFGNNLVPYLRLKFLLSSLSPIVSSDKLYYESPSISSLSEICLQQSSTMATCDQRYGKFIAANVMYRGHMLPSAVDYSIRELKWNPMMQFISGETLRGGMTGPTQQALEGGNMAAPPQFALMLSNNTAFSDVLGRFQYQFDSLFSKRSFLQWYTGEGMEIDQFQEAREDLESLQMGYKEASTQCIDSDSSEEFE